MVAPQPFFRPRGTPFSVLHRIRALLAAGHKVDLITYPFGEPVEMEGLRIIRSGRPPFVHDVKIGPSFAKILLDVPLYFRTVAALRKNSYDVLHTHEEAAFFGVGLAARYGLVHVYDMHSSLPQQLANFGKFNFGPFRAMFRALENRTLRTCDGVITICQDLANIALAEIGQTPHAMIENTADDATVFPPKHENVRQSLGLKGSQVVLYTGTFESYQGLDLLLESFRHVPDAHLLMVGGQAAQVAAEQRRAADLGIADRTSFLGTVHPSRIPDLLQLADVIVSPRSTGRNTPLKIYNYLRSGRPLVATDMWTHTQTLTPQTAVLAKPMPEEFAAGIRALLDDPEFAARMGAAGRAFAETEFSDAGYVARVQEFYASVMERARDRARC